MDSYKVKTAQNFSKLLRNSLKVKYPYVKLTASFVASEFNLRARSSNHISGETARKWLSGASIPAVHRIQVFVDWLDIKTSDFVFKDNLLVNNISQVNVELSHLNYDQLVSFLAVHISQDKDKLKKIIELASFIK